MPNSSELEPMAQGPARLATAEELDKDERVGFTNPNLHRRIKTDTEIQYQVGVYGTDSWRTLNTSNHDEESETCEIP